MQEFQEIEQEQETHISEYWLVLAKRKIIILAVFMLTISITAVFVFRAIPVYESSAKLIIDKDRTTSPISGKRMDYESIYSQSIDFKTHIQLMTSSAVLSRVIDAMTLDRFDSAEDSALTVNPVKEFITQLKTNIRLLLQKQKTVLTPHEKRMALINSVRNKIKITEVRDTRLLTINVRDKNPVTAANLANTLADTYMEYILANKMDSSKQTLGWLNNELYELRKNLEDAEQAFFDYKQENQIFSISGKQKMTEQKIGEFNNRYLEARNRRLELDAKINELTSLIKGTQGFVNVRSLVTNPILDTIYRKMVELELELTRQSKVFREKHPKIQQLKSEIDKSEARFKEEIGKELNNLKSERKVLLAREQTLEKTIAEFETDALDTSTKELKYSILERNVNTNQNLYDLMLSRIKETNIIQTSDPSNIRIVEPAVTPVFPVSPNKKRSLLLGAVVGLFLGVCLAFFLEYMDQTVRTEHDIKSHFNLPVLAVIPKADKSESYGVRQ